MKAPVGNDYFSFSEERDGMKEEDWIIRVNEKTPAGGDYSIGYCFKWVEGKMVPAIPEEAEGIEICEFTNDGEMICSTLGRCNPHKANTNKKDIK